ncbi:MAG: DUF4435 domain-containing protein [bacterium]|nr:DUF4435 domain-containing protein [bacterium]
MKEHINGHNIANTIRMSRSQHIGSFLVVEGDTDARVYKRFVEHSACLLIPSHNKDNALKALEVLDKVNFDGALAIVDADYWHLDGIEPDSPNLFLTDTHDLETTILSTDEVVEKVLSEFGQTKRIKQLHNSPINIILSATLPIGFLRWFSLPSKDNLRVKFRELLLYANLECFIDTGNAKLEININKLLKEAKSCSDNSDIDEQSIKKKIKSSIKEDHDPWQVCSGHDMVRVLTMGLCLAFGNKNAKTLTPELVEGVLRMAYEYSHFRRTRLYSSIKNWETVNPAFKVLK